MIAQRPADAESDPAIVVERVSLRRPDGMIDAYAAYPKSVRGNTPGIVVAMHEWGVDAYVRNVVRYAAKLGFTCIAPNLYARMQVPDAEMLQRKQYSGDLRAAGLHLLSKAPNCKLGILGLGVGGHLALVQTLDNSDLFDAAAPIDGIIGDVAPSEIHFPICASYGVRDGGATAEDIRAWRGGLRVPNDVRGYASAGHAFFDDTRTSYVASAADDAWKRTLSFFKDQLGLQPL